MTVYFAPMKTGIKKFKNVLDTDTCNALINIVENNLDKAVDYPVYEHRQNVIRKELPIISADVDDIVHKALEKTLLEYQDEYRYLIATRDVGFVLRKISGATREHADVMQANDSRNLSIIVGLNSDYEEGTFHFPYQEYTTTVKQGEAIIFPVWFPYPHYVDAPIGYRYTVHTWLQY